MTPEIGNILSQLQQKGANALELLPSYQHGELSLWQESPELHRAFARKLISEGHPTRAFELAREGLAQHPNDCELIYLVALALARGGNISLAESHLATLLARTDLSPALHTSAVSLEGRLYKDRFERAKSAELKAELAGKSAEAYERAAAPAGLDHFSSINVATMALLSGDVDKARRWAKIAIEQVERDPNHDENYWCSATLGEAQLLLEDLPAARKSYRRAIAQATERGDVGSIASMRRNALLIREKLEFDDEFLRLFYVGSVVIFCGHMLDSPSRATRERLPPRFPPDPQLIREVSSAIKVALAEVNATVGFCSAACGSDILFAEHMLDRYGELHIVLPFAQEDFYATSVDFNDPERETWRARFDAVLKRATEIHYATTEPYLGDDVLLDFVNDYTQGLAIMRAQQRGVNPQALVVLDPQAPRLPGGTGRFLETWEAGGHAARVINLAELRERILGPAPASPAAAPSAPVARPERLERTIKAVLFADVKGYSKLREEDSPRFSVRFLHEVASVLSSLKNPPVFANTAGDGVLLVFEYVSDCAAAALRILERADQVDWRALGMSEGLLVRIGIHAGPVFAAFDPVIGKTNFFGSHMNRAARIEPVTIPGCAYASEQFAALLALGPGSELICEYLGVEKLAKEFGRCTLYRVLQR